MCHRISQDSELFTILVKESNFNSDLVFVRNFICIHLGVDAKKLTGQFLFSLL